DRPLLAVPRADADAVQRVEGGPRRHLIDRRVVETFDARELGEMEMRSLPGDLEIVRVAPTSQCRSKACVTRWPSGAMTLPPPVMPGAGAAGRGSSGFGSAAGTSPQENANTNAESAAARRLVVRLAIPIRVVIAGFSPSGGFE